MVITAGATGFGKVPIFRCVDQSIAEASSAANPIDGLDNTLRNLYDKPTSITTSVQGGMWGDARMAARRLAWERLARSLLSCVSSSHRSNSVGPNRSRGSISRTTR